MVKILWLLLCVCSTAPRGSGQSGENNTADMNWDDFKGFLPPAIIAELNNTLALDEDEDDKPAIAGPKVAYGTPATYGDYPHQASLRLSNEDNRHFCGASVIHPLLLLSAAHCFDSYKPPHIEAIAGEHSLRTSDGKEQARNVTHLIVHKKWNSETWENDIAILVLNEPLTFNPYVRPIRIRDSKWKLPPTANISGWGKTHDGFPSDTLMSAEILIRDHQECTEKFRKSNYNVTNNMICAGGHRDACEGDSGGPLTCVRNRQSGQGEHYLCGIVSWGLNCGTKRHRYPGVYTDISKYEKWIRKQTRPWWKHYWITEFGKAILPDSSDCGEGNFRCPNNGLCIPETLKCDGENDCHPMDNDSDESNCDSVSCRGTNFQCNSTLKCLPRNYICDGDDDCGDNSDEGNCM